MAATIADAHLEVLEDWGAGAMPHPGGTLLAHLERTANLLAAWGASDDLVLAALFHATYGTDGFALSLKDLDERDVLRAQIGEAAEAIAWFYAACDREATYPTITPGEPCVFRDRFTGNDITPSKAQLYDFVELTIANELDLVDHNPAFADQHGAGFKALFGRWLPLASDGAKAYYQDVLGA